MKLIDGLKLKGKQVEIPDCSRDDLPQLFVDLGFKTGAEIGVDRGEFSQKFCQAGLTLYAIDPWQAYAEYVDPSDQKRLDSRYQQTQDLLAKYPTCTILRKTSMEALADFADASLDFVYLDGNHQLKYVIDDLCGWFTKVHSGGILCGHDYIYTTGRTPAATCHVIYALNAFVASYKIRNWYLIGRAERLPNEQRDRFRSWMFVKP